MANKSVKEPIKVLACAALGLLVRLITTTNYKEELRQRVEVTTPTSDWKRVQEAVYLWNSGVNPYLGNIFHEYPISLQFYKIILSYSNVDLTFAFVDIITSYLLKHSIYNQLLLTKHNQQEARSRSWLVYLIYLFSPITIISCAGQSTAIFTNFLVAVICFILPIEQFRVLACVICAFLTCNNIHFANLVLPILMSIAYCTHLRRNKPGPYYDDTDYSRSLWTSVAIYVLSLITLVLTSYILMGNSWSFLRATYLFVIKVQDLMPNVGMTWYFFTEGFDQFLNFFTWVIQLNSLVHAIPISTYLRDKPFFAMFITMLLGTIFQPYPNLSHVGLVTSILPQYLDLFPHMQRGFNTACVAITSLSLMPVFWHLWIVMGTANANFYFGATLAFTASLIFLLTDLLLANGYMSAKLKFERFIKEKYKIKQS